jgi:ribosomal protein L37E
MALSKCARCKRVFTKVRSPICPNCEPDEEQDYEKARDSLQETPNQNPEELAESSGVELECILRLLEAGRIAAAPYENVRCGRCGAPAISISKKLCEACLQRLNQELASAQSKIKLPNKRDVEVGTAMNIRKWVEEEDEE